MVQAYDDFIGALGPLLVVDTLQARAEILLNLYRFIMNDLSDPFAVGVGSLQHPILSMLHLFMVAWWATRASNRVSHRVSPRSQFFVHRLSKKKILVLSF